MLTKQVLEWINHRRAEILELEPLDDLREAGSLADDPLIASMPPGTIWVGGKLQYFGGGGVIQVTLEDFVRRWLEEWAAGEHPEYD